METPLLDAVDLPPEGEHCATVIWLHGLGADGHDFEPLIPELGLRARGVRVLLPHAPVQPVTLNQGMAMRAWYDIYDMSLARIDEAGIRDSVAMVRALIDRERAAGIDSRRILLAGFSQGGVIATQAGLTYPEPLAGVMALSTYLALPETLDQERSAANAGTPVLVAHGEQDPVVPFMLGERLRDTLQQWGNPVTFHDYAMGHSVCPQEITHIQQWLQQHI